MGRSTFSSDDIVIKSPNDKRLYRLIELENGLTALLIHDPEIYPQGPPICEEDEAAKLKTKENGGAASESETKKAAAAMCVGIGSFSDPLEAQGLAHFLEHMLFMGSTQFPVENEYKSYLHKHGGSSNAYTFEEHTCYHFEVKREFLKGALTRFSQFFVSPLMESEAMERELQAIDSEFNRILQNDFCRLKQLQSHTSSPGHPFNKFSWGNKKSLDDAKEKGIDLRERILKLYRDYYHGGLMKLVVIGGESLNVLEQWVLELYGDVEKGPQVNMEFKAECPIWEAGKVYRLEAVQDDHILQLAWTLPCLHKHYLKSPEFYLCHLLAHQCRGGLHFYLKARGLVTTLTASVDRYSVAYVFSMDIYLTDSGLEKERTHLSLEFPFPESFGEYNDLVDAYLNSTLHGFWKVFEIIGFVYQYIKLLRQVLPQEWIFWELQDKLNMTFRYLEEEPQDDYATELGVNLLRYPAEHVIYGDYLLETWDEELLEYVLGFFRPENMRIDVISKSSTMSEDFQREPWFGSHYTEEDVSQSLMNLWKDPPEIDASFHLPEKNEFIPCDFSIRSDVSCLNIANTTHPRCILDEPLLKLWYKLDRTFKVPRVSAYFRIKLKGAIDNLKSFLMTGLYIDLLWDELNEIIYQARTALLGAYISGCNDSLDLQFHGFNDKLPSLLSKFLTKIKSFLPNHDRFKVIKESKERELKNSNMNPQSHGAYLRLQVLHHIAYDVDEGLHVLNGLSVSDMKSFIPELWSKVFIEGFCHGNLLEEEAISLSNILKTKFFVQPLPIELRHKNHCICLPPSANLIRDARVKNKSETNSVIELYFQIEPDVGIESTRLRALIRLFNDIVWEPFSDQLRTKEQLGYSVGCYWVITWRVFGFCFNVQSSEYNPIYLQERIDNFINGLEEFLKDDDSFESYRGGLMENLLLKDQSLSEETSRFWHEITNKYMFDINKKVAEEVKSLEKEDVINFYKTYMQQSSPKRRRLAIRVWGCNTDFKEAEARPEVEQVIEDLAAFNLSSKFYPSDCF